MVLEGTWEEIAQHADELSGKVVQLTVIGEDFRPATNGAAGQSSSPAGETEKLFNELAAQWRGADPTNPDDTVTQAA